jgi:hypothetical protein
MLAVYATCVIGGGSFLALYCLLTFFHYGEHVGGSSLNFVQQVLAPVSLVLTGLVLFGLAGLICLANDIDDLFTVVAAAVVATLPLSVTTLLQRLDASGARARQAVGRNGTVEETVPAGKEGQGKVVLKIGNRAVAYQAVTAAAELPAGAAVHVVGVLGPDLVEVAADVDYDKVWRDFRGRPKDAPSS